MTIISVPGSGGMEGAPVDVPLDDWDGWADDYDVLEHPAPSETDAAVAALTRLAGTGPVLELAAGTGRIALPLARAGVDMTAADVSPAMLARLRAGDGGDLVRTRVERMPVVEADRPYALAMVLLNSVWAVVDPGGHRELFRAVRKALRPGGLFLIEMGASYPQPSGVRRQVEFSGGGTGWLVGTDEAATQLSTLRYEIDGSPRPVREIRFRRLFPQQAMLIAELEGFELAAAWSGWDGAPFGTGSPEFIGMFRRPA